MKNFRKVLALILVVATLFSFVAMASAKNAEDYTDYDKVSYVEAVDVMTAIGINEGHNDGSFAPTATIDRDEVAAMVARLRYDGEFDADLFVGADNVFADVKGQWSEGYVTYCAGLGIINGRNATTFDPDGKVTGVETLKMLLCVLGYDAELQGYTGANWQTAVIRDANKMDLLIDGVDVYKAATREEVAQYFLNALEARLVFGYIGEGIVKLSNSMVAIEEWPFTSVTLPELADKDMEVAYCNAVISWKTLADVLGVGCTSGIDCFGRPGTVWSVGSWSKFHADAPAAKYTTCADLTTDFGAYVTKQGYDVCLYADGRDLDDGMDLATAEKYTGNGILTEVYLTTDDVNGKDEVRVVVIGTFVNKVVDTSSRYGWAEIAGGVRFENTIGAEYGDYVLFNICNGDCGSEDEIGHGAIHAVEIAEIKTLTVDEVWRDADCRCEDYVTTADGETFNYNGIGWAQSTVEVDEVHYPMDLLLNRYAVGETYDYILDDYGYIIWMGEHTEESKISVAYYVEGTNTRTPAMGTNTLLNAWDYAATAVDFDAVVTEGVEISEGLYNTMYDYYYAYGNEAVPGALHTSQYQLGVLAAKIGDEYRTATIADAGSYLSATTGLIHGERGVACNADTKYLIRTYNFDKGVYEYSTATGYMDVANYVGAVVIEKAEQSWVTLPTIQYLNLDGDEAGLVDYLFVDAFYEKANSDMFYVTGKAGDAAKLALSKFFPGVEVYDAIIDGEETYVVTVPGVIDERAPQGLYRGDVQSVNATYRGKKIILHLGKTGLDKLSNGQFDALYVANGQIFLFDDVNPGTHKPGYDGNYENATLVVPAVYNADLTITLIANPDDETSIGTIMKTMTGAEFVEWYKAEDWDLGSIWASYNDDGQVTGLYVQIF